MPEQDKYLRTDKKIGLKFIFQIAELMRDEPVIEKNEILQKRINAAANHFEPKLTAYQQAIQNHPLVTEHREVSNVINETLSQLLLAVHTAHYFLAYCKEPFSVTTFLQHKLKFAQPKFIISCYASGKKQSFSDVPNAELYDTIKRWRDMVCDESGMPIYMVANQATLKEIATFLPFTKKSLMKISGFGKAKAEKYGDDILDAVQDFCTRHNIESNMDSKPENQKKERKKRPLEEKTPTNITTYNLFKEGKSLAEIAKERNMTPGTIEGHLAPFIAGGEIDIDKVVSKEKQLLVKEAILIHGRLSTKTLKDNLPENISYGEIRMVMASDKVEQQS